VAEGNSRTIKVQLLDSALGNPLQSWGFSGADRITIGRAPENDISVVDPHVSRLHVELVCTDGTWHIQSHGRNGTWIHGSKVDGVIVSHRTIFQLGSSGPILQFLVEECAPKSPMATLDNIEPSDFDFLNINQQQLADEVMRIAETEAFQRLQNESQRQRRAEDPDRS
jgi:pSer/pThr/pTyr-binding forkhead associated (FHA) protein